MSSGLSALTQLEEILGWEGAIIGEMVNLSAQQRQMIARQDLDALSQVTQEQEKGIARLEVLERKRNAALELLAGEMGIGSHPVAASVLQDHLPETERERFQELRLRLSQRLEALAMSAGGNATLLASSIANLRRTIEFLARIQQEEAFYLSSGKPQDLLSSRGRVMDQHI